MKFAQRKYFVDVEKDRNEVAGALADGAVVAHAFGNFYVITTGPNDATVRRVNVMKGRPPEQVGSVVTTRCYLDDLFDWEQLPLGLTRGRAMAMIDALYGRGPFGFRGPATAGVPAHLTFPDGDVITTQVIAPGYACPSNSFLARTLALLPEPYLYVTSANRSRHQTGAEDEPAHFRAAGLIKEFGHEPDFVVLHHRDETAARTAYPRYMPMSTTVLGLHKLGPCDERGRPQLFVERHGSLHVDDVRDIVAEFGFGLALGPKAGRRLALREYADMADAGDVA